MKFNVDIKPEIVKQLLVYVDTGVYAGVEQAVNELVAESITQRSLRTPVELDWDRLAMGLSDSELINSVVEKIKPIVKTVPYGVEFSAMLLVARLPLTIQKAVEPRMASRIGVLFAKWAKAQSDIKVTKNNPQPYTRIKQ